MSKHVYEKMLASAQLNAAGQERFVATDIPFPVVIFKAYRTLWRRLQEWSKIRSRRKEIIAKLTSVAGDKDEIVKNASGTMLKYLSKDSGPVDNGKELLKNLKGVENMYESLYEIVRWFDPKEIASHLWGKEKSHGEHAWAVARWNTPFKKVGRDTLARQFTPLVNITLRLESGGTHSASYPVFKVTVEETASTVSKDAKIELSKSDLKELIRLLGSISSYMEMIVSLTEKSKSEIETLSKNEKFANSTVAKTFAEHLHFINSFADKISKYGNEAEAIAASFSSAA